MVRHTDEADDETPAETPPTFDDLIDVVDDLSEGDHIRVPYAHKSRHTLREPDEVTVLDGYVTVADVTREPSHGKNRDRFRLEFRTNHPDSEYAGTLYRIKTGGVNKTRSNPCYVSKSTGPSVRHFDQLGRVDAIDAADDDTTVRTDGGDDAAHADAHDLSEGDTVEFKATPLSGDEPGTITGTVTDATIHTLDGDEVGSTVKIADVDGNRLVRNGAGTLSVEDDDGFLVTIAWDSTLRRVETDGGFDIIVAGDDGVILSDDEDDDTGHTVDPDDDGVELLSD